MEDNKIIHVEYDSDPSASEKKKQKKNTIFRQINNTTSKCEHTKINIFFNRCHRTNWTNTEFRAVFQAIGVNKQRNDALISPFGIQRNSPTKTTKVLYYHVYV
jgi:hypothetical protein